jgi:hypothetical protein
VKKIKLNEHLKKFEIEHKINSKGPLCVVLAVTRSASNQTPPYTADNKGVKWPGLDEQQCKPYLRIMA